MRGRYAPNGRWQDKLGWLASLAILALLAMQPLAVLLAEPNPAAPRATAGSPSRAAMPDKLAVAPRVDFNRDVRPILSNTCFRCHGPDEKQRQAGLRLDRRDDIVKELESGEHAVVPGDVAKSELVRRINAQDPDEHMPPAKSGKKLSAAQIVTLTRWIEQGAKWSDHWSFLPAQRPPLPQVRDPSVVRNAIDRFVVARLDQEGLRPASEADRTTLIRRVTLDLTGLPPTPDEVDVFVADTSPDAYEKVVDRLLASPQYGERMAVDWLDAARYADTHGYHIDSQRDMWRWREWVIESFNRGQPFDQFTIEQVAGDLLPGATVEQKLASGFHRNHMINFEGGAIPEEYLNAYIVDRVNTTGMVWLGLSINCTQCHDHKYDPLTQREFYQLYAFFHNLPENGLDGQQGNAAPLVKAPNERQARQAETLRRQIASLEQQQKERAVAAAPVVAEWEAKMRASGMNQADISRGLVAYYDLNAPAATGGGGAAANPAFVADGSGQNRHGTIQGPATWVAGKLGGALKLDGQNWADLGDTAPFERTDAFSYGCWINPATSGHGAALARMDDAANFRGYDLYLGGGQVFVHIINQWESNAIRLNSKQPLPLNQWHHVLVTYDGSSKAEGIKLYVGGKPVETVTTHNSLSGSIKTDKPLHIGKRNPGAPFVGLVDDVRIYSRALTAAEAAALAGADPIGPILAIAADKRSPPQQETLRQHFLANFDEPYKQASAELAKVRGQDAELAKAIPTSMVMQELPKPRDTFMLFRGQYDKKGDKVTAGVPAALSPLPAGAPANRLGLARWLVDPGHPLVSRVIVNRYWQMYFGTGIVKTAEDLGAQGEWPSHPELLDYLATEFVASGWDVKGMQRSIVMSATYRQSSAVSRELAARDPENRLLARGPRVRLQAEFVRDQALAASGLLHAPVGGPSVSPYQPPGLWEEMAFGGGFSAQTYKQSKGEDLYRRTMYTFWKRTVPPAALSTFDAPDREVCTVRRARTNTPLQALVLMNDPTYVEAARKLAERMMTEAGPAAEDRITLAFRLCTARRPSPRELAVLKKMFDDQLTANRKDSAAAMKLLSVGESKRNEKLDAAELAAWTTVASVILNLDETITKG